MSKTKKKICKHESYGYGKYYWCIFCNKKWLIESSKLDLYHAEKHKIEFPKQSDYVAEYIINQCWGGYRKDSLSLWNHAFLLRKANQ